MASYNVLPGPMAIVKLGCRHPEIVNLGALADSFCAGPKRLHKLLELIRTESGFVVLKFHNPAKRQVLFQHPSAGADGGGGEGDSKWIVRRPMIGKTNRHIGSVRVELSDVPDAVDLIGLVNGGISLIAE